MNELKTSYSDIEETIEPDYLIFAIHTYYAILIKFLVTQLLNQTKMKIKLNEQINFDTPENAHFEIARIENGHIFRALGINNFIEDDFFSWYLDVWDEEIYSLIKTFFRKTGEYNFAETISLDDSSSSDLLRKLYNYLMPKCQTANCERGEQQIVFGEYLSLTAQSNRRKHALAGMTAR